MSSTEIQRSDHPTAPVVPVVPYPPGSPYSTAHSPFAAVPPGQLHAWGPDLPVTPARRRLTARVTALIASGTLAAGLLGGVAIGRFTAPMTAAGTGTTQQGTTPFGGMDGQLGTGRTGIDPDGDGNLGRFGGTLPGGTAPDGTSSNGTVPGGTTGAATGSDTGTGTAATT